MLVNYSLEKNRHDKKIQKDCITIYQHFLKHFFVIVQWTLVTAMHLEVYKASGWSMIVSCYCAKIWRIFFHYLAPFSTSYLHFCNATVNKLQNDIILSESIEKMKTHLPRRRAESRSSEARAKCNSLSSDTQFKG